MEEKPIYNLEFPRFIDTLDIGGYKFRCVDNYKEAYLNLEHFGDCVIGGFGKIKDSNASHQITATVQYPPKEEKCCLPWKNRKLTKLYDILLLLSLFTGRNVFVKDWEGDYTIISDSRQHQYGGQLQLSLPNNFRWRDKKTGKILRNEEKIKITPHYREYVNLDFDKSIDDVMALISSKAWQEKYNGGYFLFLFKQAVQRQIIETSFIMCWTIWEHLFALSNKNWLDDTSIEKFSGNQKIAYILNKYFLKNIDKSARKEIIRLKNARNRIIHFGIKTKGVDNEEMQLFIRLTEQLVAITLNLQPSNLFNSTEKLKDFLKT